jgi:hypothetical protein
VATDVMFLHRPSLAEVMPDLLPMNLARLALAVVVDGSARIDRTGARTHWHTRRCQLGVPTLSIVAAQNDRSPRCSVVHRIQSGRELGPRNGRRPGAPLPAGLHGVLAVDLRALGRPARVGRRAGDGPSRSPAGSRAVLVRLTGLRGMERMDEFGSLMGMYDPQRLAWSISR